MVRHTCARLQAQELTQRQAVGAPPLQRPLTVEAFEVADQVHPEVTPRWDSRTSDPWRVIGLTQVLGERIETGIDQHLLQLVVKHVAGRARHLCPTDHQVHLSIPLSSQRHDEAPDSNHALVTESDGRDFFNGLLRGRRSERVGQPGGLDDVGFRKLSAHLVHQSGRIRHTGARGD